MMHDGNMFRFNVSGQHVCARGQKLVSRTATEVPCLVRALSIEVQGEFETQGEVHVASVLPECLHATPWLPLACFDSAASLVGAQLIKCLHAHHAGLQAGGRQPPRLLPCPSDTAPRLVHHTPASPAHKPQQ